MIIVHVPASIAAWSAGELIGKGRLESASRKLATALSRPRSPSQTGSPGGWQPGSTGQSAQQVHASSMSKPGGAAEVASPRSIARIANVSATASDGVVVPGTTTGHL